MGMAKKQLMEEEFRGYRMTQKMICRKCLVNPDLKRYAFKYRSNGVCDFCKKNLHTGVSLDDLISDVILPGIRMEYDDPSECNIFSDGEYRGECISTTDVIENELGEESQQVKNCIVRSISQEFWTNRYLFIERDEEFHEYNWFQFTELVKKKTRYLFYENRSVQILDIISEYLTAVGSDSKTGLFKVLKPGTRRLYRARGHKLDEIKEKETEKEFGPPPVSKTQSLRMSAEGISLFYCSYEEKTAIDELKFFEPECITIGSFLLSKDICILDLTRVSSLHVPGIFSVNRSDRSKYEFLKSFVRDISQPVVSNPGIEYVPTQIVTEYLRDKLELPANYSRFDRINGIVYPSSRNPGGHCLVLFMDYDAFNSDGSKCLVDKKSFQYKHFPRIISYF